MSYFFFFNATCAARPGQTGKRRRAGCVKRFLLSLVIALLGKVVAGQACFRTFSHDGYISMLAVRFDSKYQYRSHPETSVSQSIECIHMPVNTSHIDVCRRPCFQLDDFLIMFAALWSSGLSLLRSSAMSELLTAQRIRY